MPFLRRRVGWLRADLWDWSFTVSCFPPSAVNGNRKKRLKTPIRNRVLLDRRLARCRNILCLKRVSFLAAKKPPFNRTIPILTRAPPNQVAAKRIPYLATFGIIACIIAPFLAHGNGVLLQLHGDMLQQKADFRYKRKSAFHGFKNLTPQTPHRNLHS